MRPARRIARVLAAGSLAVGLATCATHPATGGRRLSLISESQEVEMGREADASIVAQMGLLPDSALQRYVSDLGLRLARASERPNLPWTFRVVDDPAVNAFAIPGGFVYVTRGIMTHLNSEAELVAVLGHEIGHVTARHSVSQMSKQQLAQAGLVVGMILSPEVAQFGNLAEAGLGSSPAYLVFLAIILGNGMRYGLRPFAEAAVGGALFVAAVLTVRGTDYLSAMSVTGLFFLLFGAIVVLYSYSLLQRIDRQRQHLVAESSVDTLTGLLNRRGLTERAERLFGDLRSHRRPLAVMFAVLDGFQGINDALGHHVGDTVLRKVAGLIHASIRDSDLAARYGGDEFVVVMPETNVSQAKVVGPATPRISASSTRTATRSPRHRATAAIRRPNHSRRRDRVLGARHAIVDRRGSSFRGRAGQAPAPHAQSGARLEGRQG